MPLSELTLKSILNNTGSVIIKSSDYSELALKSFALTAKTNGVHLTIIVNSRISELALKSIVKNGQNSVTLDLTLL